MLSLRLKLRQILNTLVHWARVDFEFRRYIKITPCMAMFRFRERERERAACIHGFGLVDTNAHA